MGFSLLRVGAAEPSFKVEGEEPEPLENECLPEIRQVFVILILIRRWNLLDILSTG